MTKNTIMNKSLGNFQNKSLGNLKNKGRNEEMKTVNTNLDSLRKIYQDTKAEKDAEIRKLNEAIETAREEIETAEADLEDAVSNGKAQLFEDAKTRKIKAETSLDFCQKRIPMIKKGFISEETSDEFIDSILKIEDGITKEYEKAVREKVQELESLTNAYRADIRETEAVMNDWTRDIHANYRTFGRCSYVQPDGTRSDRSPKPVKVHGDFVEYTGTFLSQQVLNFLARVRED